MAQIAAHMVKAGGKWYPPGSELPKTLKKADLERLRANGAVVEGIDEADVKAAKAFKAKLEAARSEVEQAEEALAAAEAAIQQADSPEATKTAEDERDTAQELLEAAQQRLAALQD